MSVMFQSFMKPNIKWILALVFMLNLQSMSVLNASEKIYNEPEGNYLIFASRNPSFVWFAVPKAGTSSICQILSKNKVHCFAKGNRIPFYSEEWRHIFKFTFVRNPWERVVSCYLSKVLPKNYGTFRECYNQDFDYFVDFINRQNLECTDQHIQLQTALFPFDEVDYIGRMENFEIDLSYIMGMIGIPYDQIIPHENKTNHPHYSQFYTDRTKEIISRKYKKDIEALGYTFEYDVP